MSWKEYRLVFHWPLPLAVIALVTYGALVSPTIHLDRLAITYLLVLFGLVLTAYPLDALKSDWKFMIKGIQPWKLISIGALGLAGFIAISAYAIIQTSRIGILVAVVLILAVVCYNLETPSWIHNKYGFAITWGSLAIVASYFYQSIQLNWIMIPLGVTGFIIAMQEWYTTNTKSPIQQSLTKLKTINYLPIDELAVATREKNRITIRKETFRITSIYCYANLSLALTLLAWRVL